MPRALISLMVALAFTLGLGAVPAAAGKRPPIIVAVERGDTAALGRLLKKARPRDLDASDLVAGSPTVGLRAIEVAARKGDRGAAEALLAAGAQATAKALELAAAGGFLELTRRLVERGAPRADLALSAAARAGHAEVVEWLLPAAVRADPFFNLDQVLEFAVYFPPAPSAAVVAVLLRAKANPARAWGPGRQTALHMAVTKGAADVVAVLLAAGAPIDAVDRDGYTPLLGAVAGGRFELAATLLDAGATPHHVGGKGQTVPRLLVPFAPAQAGPLLDRVLAAGVSVDHAGPGGETALMAAAAAGSLPWVELLLARGARAGALAADGRAAIDFALSCAVSHHPWSPQPPAACHADVALRLLAGPRPPTGRLDRGERTPLVRAIMTGSDALVARMLALGASSPGLDREGSGPLHYAARYGTPAMVKRLVDARLARPSDQNQRDETPLDVARLAGRDDMAAALAALASP